MKFGGFGVFVFLAIASGCSAGAVGDQGSAESVGSSAEAIIGPSTPGGRDQVVMVYAQLNNGQTEICSGSYFAPRVIVTAAHCLNNIFADQLFVYYGDNYSADFGQLGPGPNGLLPPAPGQPSNWAQADSWDQNPGYVTSGSYPDIGFVYLDRKPPFDPLPILRTAVAANATVTISGWGANSAPTPTTGAGSGVQRTGTTKTLGAPTTADQHPEDPNPAIATAAQRATQIKLDGHAPNANTCFGDSGGPILITQNGQTYIAGVNYFGGLSCADYSLAMRIDSFLPFFDAAYQKGGQSTLIPAFDCVTPNPSGSLTAYFGYNNQNGVNVTVPYGTKNALARDTTNQRPKLFLHGKHDYSFGVDLTSGQTVSWTLSPDNSPTTTLNVTSSSRRCGAADLDQSQCALSCRASQRSGCPNLPSFEDCVSQCVGTAQFFEEIFPACTQAYRDFNSCTAGVAPTPASNWECLDFSTGTASTPCATQITALNACISAN